MLAYYIAFYGGQLGDDPEIARKYYTIAAMHDDTPEITRILAVLASSPKDDPKSIAMNFALLGLGGYDTAPYQCHALGEQLLSFLHEPNLSDHAITSIASLEKNLIPPEDQSNRGVNSCYEMIERATKYTYIAYITEKSSPYPNILHADTLVEEHIIPFLPVPQMHSGMTLEKVNNIWNYKNR